jgi:hypothetical protein
MKIGPSFTRSLSFALAVFGALMTGTSSANDSASMLDRDSLDSAMRRARILAQQYWTEEPFPAARSLCIDLWQQLALLDDSRAVNRLHMIARTDPDRFFSAALALHSTGDTTMVKNWRRLAADSTEPIQERMKATVLSSPFYDFGLSQMPAELEQLCLEILADPTTKTLPDRLLAVAGCMSRKRCTVDSRLPLETLLRDEIGKGMNKPGLTYQSISACTADSALDALSKICSPESKPVYEWVVERSPWPNVQRKAAIALADLGEAPIAVSTLQDVTRDYTYDRVMDAYVLVELGEPESRTVLIRALHDPNKSVRAAAYQALSKLGDAAFLEPAVADYDEQGLHNGFQWLGGQGLSEVEPHRTFQTRYLLAIAQSARRPGERMLALSLAANNDTFENELLVIARTVLDEPQHSLSKDQFDSDPEIEAWEYRVERHIVLLRLGTPEEKVASLDRVMRIYNMIPPLRTHVVNRLGSARFPGAQSFLINEMNRDHSETEALIHLSAAISLFKIVANGEPS